MSEHPLLLSVAEAGALLGLKRSSAYLLVKDGTLPKIKLGARALIHRRHVEELAERLAAEAVAAR